MSSVHCTDKYLLKKEYRMNLEVEHNSADHYELFTIKGNITVSTMSMITSELNKITEWKPNKYLVLDLSKVNLIDSNGLGLIIREGNKLKNMKSMLYILNPSQNVLKILRETNMTKYLPVIDKIDRVFH